MDAALADDLARGALAPAARPSLVWAVWALRLLEIHLAMGVVFAVAFHLRGMRRIETGVEGTTWGFRALVTPGVVALGPWLARVWRRAAPPQESNVHRDAAAAS